MLAVIRVCCCIAFIIIAIILLFKWYGEMIQLAKQSEREEMLERENARLIEKGREYKYAAEHPQLRLELIGDAWEEVENDGK